MSAEFSIAISRGHSAASYLGNSRVRYERVAHVRVPLADWKVERHETESDRHQHWRQIQAESQMPKPRGRLSKLIETAVIAAVCVAAGAMGVYASLPTFH